MGKKDLNKMSLDEMKNESLECAFEIAKLSCIIEKHQKRFNELSYNIWKIMNDETNRNDVSANTKSNK